MPLTDPHPALDDGVVRLREWSMGDLLAVEAASREVAIVETTTVPEEYTAAAGRAFVERQWGRARDGEGWTFAIADSVSGDTVGAVALMLRPQPGVAGLGYWVLPDARRAGYASRAVDLLTTWALGGGEIERVEAWIEPGNDASVGVVERAGFTYEGRLRSFYTLEGGRRIDALTYSRVAEDLYPRR
jgi:RimJ/RimL family protein N-acetyltransferase